MSETLCFVVPIDGSEHSHKTLAKAIEMAKEQSADLVLVQVIEPLIHNEMSDPFHELNLPSQDALAAEGFGTVEKTITESGVTFTRVVIQGSPADKIVQVADKHNAQLIIIGRRGHGAIRKFLLGSVTDRVVQHANCDVLVVH